MAVREHVVVYRIEQGGEIVACRVVGSKWVDGRQMLIGYAGDDIDPANCFLTEEQAMYAIWRRAAEANVMRIAELIEQDSIRQNTAEVMESAREMLIEVHPFVCDCSRCIQERQARHEQDCRRLERESDRLSAEHEAFTLAKLAHEAAALGVDVPSGPEPEVPAVLQEIYDTWRWDESACQWVIVEDGEPEAEPPTAPKPETWRDRAIRDPLL